MVENAKIIDINGKILILQIFNNACQGCQGCSMFKKNIDDTIIQLKVSNIEKYKIGQFLHLKTNDFNFFKASFLLFFVPVIIILFSSIISKIFFSNLIIKILIIIINIILYFFFFKNKLNFSLYTL